MTRPDDFKCSSEGKNGHKQIDKPCFGDASGKSQQIQKLTLIYPAKKHRINMKAMQVIEKLVKHLLKLDQTLFQGPDIHSKLEIRCNKNPTS